MASVLVTAQVEDGTEWEAQFRTNGDLFSSFGVQSPVRFAVDGNAVAVVTDVADAAAYLETLGGPETVAAMEKDGVKRDTVQVFVLDKELSF